MSKIGTFRTRLYIKFFIEKRIYLKSLLSGFMKTTFPIKVLKLYHKFHRTHVTDLVLLAL